MPNTSSGLWYPDLTHDSDFFAITQQMQQSVDTVYYPPIDSAYAGILQEGVVDNSLFVTSGSVGFPRGGGFVKDEGVTNRLYHVDPGSVTLTVPANSSGNPRVDSVVIDKDGVPAYIAGTATVGATLNNRTGAPTVPNNSMRLADVLVANGAASVPNSVIRDRRPWARGAFYSYERPAASGDYSTSSTTFVAIDSTNMNPRIECSGLPLRFTFEAVVSHSATNSTFFKLLMDGATSVAETQVNSPGAGVNVPLTWSVVLPLSAIPAGSHTFQLQYAVGISGTSTVKAGASYRPNFTLEELLRQNMANNPFTTG
jgi:hypothetical protein